MTCESWSPVRFKSFPSSSGNCHFEMRDISTEYKKKYYEESREVYLALHRENVEFRNNRRSREYSHSKETFEWDGSSYSDSEDSGDESPVERRSPRPAPLLPFQVKHEKFNRIYKLKHPKKTVKEKLTEQLKQKRTASPRYNITNDSAQTKDSAKRNSNDMVTLGSSKDKPIRVPPRKTNNIPNSKVKKAATTRPEVPPINVSSPRDAEVQTSDWLMTGERPEPVVEAGNSPVEPMRKTHGSKYVNM